MSQTNTLLALAADRKKFLASRMDHALRNLLIAEQICDVDRTDSYKIENPYSSDATVTTGNLSGTYAIGTWSVTDDTLTVNTQLTVAEHIYGYENIITQFDLFADRMDHHIYKAADSIDEVVLNVMLEEATTTYSTPSGGFTTPGNILKIMGDLLGKVAGYEAQYNGTFLVIESTDLTGFVQSGAATGFTSSDKVLANGFGNKFNYMHTDVYVARTGRFTNATKGPHTWTNSGLRMFGVKKMATYAVPRNIQFEEKAVSAKTGKEVVTWAIYGVKLWAKKAPLIVEITLTA